MTEAILLGHALSLCKVINTQDYQLVKVVDKKYTRPSVITSLDNNSVSRNEFGCICNKVRAFSVIRTTLDYGIFDY